MGAESSIIPLVVEATPYSTESSPIGVRGKAPVEINVGAFPSL